MNHFSRVIIWLHQSAMAVLIHNEVISAPSWQYWDCYLQLIQDPSSLPEGKASILGQKWCKTKYLIPFGIILRPPFLIDHPFYSNCEGKREFFGQRRLFWTVFFKTWQRVAKKLVKIGFFLDLREPRKSFWIILMRGSTKFSKNFENPPLPLEHRS